MSLRVYFVKINFFSLIFHTFHTTTVGGNFIFFLFPCELTNKRVAGTAVNDESEELCKKDDTPEFNWLYAGIASVGSLILLCCICMCTCRRCCKYCCSSDDQWASEQRTELEPYSADRSRTVPPTSEKPFSPVIDAVSVLFPEPRPENELILDRSTRVHDPTTTHARRCFETSW